MNERIKFSAGEIMENFHSNAKDALSKIFDIESLSLDESLEAFNIVIDNLADTYLRAVENNQPEAIQELLKLERAVKDVLNDSNLDQDIKDYFFSLLTIKKARNLFQDNNSEFQSDLVSNAYSKLEDISDRVGDASMSSQLKSLENLILNEDLVSNIENKKQFELFEGRSFIEILNDKAVVDWKELNKIDNPTAEILSIQTAVYDAAASIISDSESLSEDQLKALAIAQKALLQNMIVFGGNEEYVRQFKNIHTVIHSILHESKAIEIHREESKRDFLRPSTRKTNDLIYGESQMFRGTVGESNLARAEKIGLSIAKDNDEISDADEQFLNELKKTFITQKTSLLSIYVDAGPSISDDDLEKALLLVEEIDRFIDWVDFILDEAVSENEHSVIELTGSDVDKELLQGWTLYSALTEVKDLAGTPPTQLTVGSNFASWGPKLQKAYKRYEILLGMASSEDQLFAKQTLKLWDLGFRTMDGASMGPVFDGLWDGINNYVDPDSIRKVEKNFGIEMDIWILRNEALKLLLGVHPTFGKTYKYPDHPIERNGKSFNEAAFESMFSQLGFSNKQDYLANRPNMTEENIDLILDFMMTVNVVPGRLIDEAYSMLCVSGSSMGHNTDKLPDDVGGKDTTSVSLNPLSSALYNILNNPHSSNHVMMNLGLLDKDLIIESFKEIGWKEEEIQTRVMEFYKEIEMLFAAMLGKHEAKEIFGIIKLKPHTPLGEDYINKTAIFPSPFESLHQEGFFDYARYFKVEGSGFAWMLQKLNEPLPDNLSSGQVIEKIVDFIKKGYGRAKLAKEDFPPEAALAMLKFYVSRVFRALDYGDRGGFYPRAVRGIEKRAYLPLVGDHRIVEINEIRAELARRIGGGATTVKSYAAGVDSIEFRKNILRIFGAVDFNVPPGKEKAQEVEVTEFGIIPWYLLNTIHYEETEIYVEHMEHKLHMGTFGEQAKEAVESMKAVLSKEGRYHHLKPPYLVLEEKKEESH